MKGFAIVTDSNADMPQDYAQENEVTELQLTYTLDGVSYKCNDPVMTPAQFYEQMRAGKMPKTAAVNVQEALSRIEPLLRQGLDVLCIMFTSALSGTCANVQLAVKELSERYPGQTVEVIDSLCASSGQWLLVSMAVDYRAQGMDLSECARRINDDRLHIAHLFTANDLFHLHRGGRISAASAVVGSVLGIKPILKVDNLGKLVPFGKVRGRRQSMLAMIDGMEKSMDKTRCDRFAISHADCPEEAKFIAEQVQKRFGITEYTINYIGPTVGSHAGPGTLALFFYANER